MVYTWMKNLVQTPWLSAEQIEVHNTWACVKIAVHGFEMAMHRRTYPDCPLENTGRCRIVASYKLAVKTF